MSESLTDLNATDAALDRIAFRERDGSHDLVLAELAMLAAAVDEAPVPPVVMPGSRPAMSNARKGGWALSVTVALMVTSSGVAAAVSNDPLGPLDYVTTQVWKIGPHNGGRMPGWALDGSMPISTVPGAAVRRAGVPQGGNAADSAQSGSGRAGTGTGSTRGSGSTSGGAGVPVIVSRTGSGPPQPGSGAGSQPGKGIHTSHWPESVGGERDPGTSGRSPHTGAGSPGGPTTPTGPHRPTAPGHQNEHTGHAYHPDAGQLPGTHRCRVDHPSIPGHPTWSGDPTSLPPCPPHTSPPQHPGTRSPKLTPTPVHPPVTTPTPPRTTPTPKPQASDVAGSLR